jgi:hypothetical protein
MSPTFLGSRVRRIPYNRAFRARSTHQASTGAERGVRALSEKALWHSRHCVLPRGVPRALLRSLTSPPRAAGEVTAVRISGRFCWVEFADPRAAQAALECEPY